MTARRCGQEISRAESTLDTQCRSTGEKFAANLEARLVSVSAVRVTPQKR
jgi:hypothetical protein